MSFAPGGPAGVHAGVLPHLILHDKRDAVVTRPAAYCTRLYPPAPASLHHLFEQARVMFAGDANSEQATRDMEPQARRGSSSWRLLAKAVINVSEANTSSARNAELATLWQSSEKYRTESLVELNQRLLSLTELSIGSRVLEIGAGTGELTELVAQHVGPTGSVVALDPSASMIDVLEQRMRRARLDNVTTMVTTIEAADLPASAFDAVLGRYVLMLIADPVSAMTKIRLSLRDAARAAMAVFSSPDHNPLFSVPPEILRRHAGLDASVEPPANLFALGDPSGLKAVFIASGYQQVTVEPITSTHRLQSVDEACRMLRGFPLIHQLESALGMPAKAAAWGEIEAWLTSMVENDVVVINIESLVAAGGA